MNHKLIDSFNLPKFDEQGYPENRIVSVGDIVHDDLTDTNCKILVIAKDEWGNVGFQIESDYGNGLRHPWELS